MKLPLLREPLFQFLVLGGALFALFSIVDKKEADAPVKIIISTARVANLADSFTRTWRRPPTAQELQDLVENHIRDEVFYREGKAAGLDRDDVVIRRRVRQKMEFIAEDTVGAEPTQEQLATYLASYPERFRVEDRLTFRHVYLSATRRADTIEDDVKQVANVLARADAAVNTDVLGDPFLLGEDFNGVFQSEVARTFGESFAKQLSVLKSGPVARADLFELWTAFRFHQRTSARKSPSPRFRSTGRATRIGKRTPSGGCAEALSHTEGTLRDRRGGTSRQGCIDQSRAMKRLFRYCFLLVLGMLLAHPTLSDELRPGYLELRQTTSDAYSLLFKVPARGDLRLGIYVNLPEGTHDAAPPRTSFNGNAYVERRSIRRDGGLTGHTISIEGLSATSTDVLVRIEALGGATQTERLSPTKTAFVVQTTPGASEVAATYLRLGIEHILFGFDHLLFVLALVILVREWRRVAITVTAFTIAHSITLAAATLGIVNVPGPPVEAAIALSIVLVAVEIVNARHGKPSLTARRPWLTAFGFGLLHGFGFAGALAEVGLPQHAIPIALLFFNLGVEIGQLVFVAAVLTLAWLLRNAATAPRKPVLLQRTVNRFDVIAAYAIGAVAAYWLIERTTAFFA